MLSGKAEVLAAIRGKLRERFERLVSAAKDAHAAATDADSKAESKYDTRTLEASYLATGQARQVEELAEALRIFEVLQLPDFEIDAAIDAGALVEVDQDGETMFYLLAPEAGGMVIEYLGGELTVLTPESPLYRKLCGLHVGDMLEQPALIITEIC